MYPIPPIVAADVFAVIPESLGHGDRQSDWASVQIHGNPAPTFLEGPVGGLDCLLNVLGPCLCYFGEGFA